MELSKQDYSEIGLEYLLRRVETITPYGQDRLIEQTPYLPSQEAELLAELSAVEFFHRLDPILTRQLSSALGPFKDIRRSLQRLSGGGVFDEVEFYEVKYFCFQVERLREVLEKLENPRLELEPTQGIFDILDPQGNQRLTFHFYDEYAPELSQLREEKRRLDRRYYQDPSDQAAITERGEVIHRLEDVIWQVRQTLSNALKPYIRLLQTNAKRIGEIDHWLAKAALARIFSGIRPQLGDNLKVAGLRNPWIESILRQKNRQLQPIDLHLEPGCTVLTGANMGGKSVSLKSLLLNVELFRHGYYVYAQEATFPLYHYISYQAQDTGSIERGLSSFGREVVMLKELLKRRHQAGLIVLDEPARGTNPSEASAIVSTLCHTYHDCAATLLLVTHFPGVARAANRHFQMSGLKVDASTIKDWSETESEEALAYLERQMDYRLIEVSADQAVPHEGIRVMQFLGMPAPFIDQIKQNLGDKHDETTA